MPDGPEPQPQAGPREDDPLAGIDLGADAPEELWAAVTEVLAWVRAVDESLR